MKGGRRGYLLIFDQVLRNRQSSEERPMCVTPIIVELFEGEACLWD